MKGYAPSLRTNGLSLLWEMLLIITIGAWEYK